MSGYRICSACGVHMLQPGQERCSNCISGTPQFAPIVSPVNIRICSVCSHNESAYVCICSFPLTDLCTVCTNKHISSPGNHCVQKKEITDFVQSFPDFERHRQRVERIEAVRARLKTWCLTTVEQAKVTLTESVKKLLWMIDKQQKEVMDAMGKTEEKIAKLDQLLEEMKTNYSVKSGTFIDIWVEGRQMELLDRLSTLVTYQHSEETPVYLSSVFQYQDSVPESVPDLSNSIECEYDQSPWAVQTAPPAQYSQSPTVQTCSTCQKYLLPYRERYNPTEQESICSCSSSVTCIVCSGVVRDQSWRAHISSLGGYEGNICSLNCFNRIQSQSMEKSEEKCVACGLLIGTNRIQLRCGHKFHNIECFYSFLKTKSTNFQFSVNYYCEICKEKIDFQVLDLFFGFANHKDVLAIHKGIVCAVCRDYTAVLSMPCKHPICTNCAKKGNASCRLCGNNASCILA